MKLSIITCTYNSEKYLQECINSVISQNIDENVYEHIFVDAYSTDNTKQIIENYMKKHLNVRLLECVPKGVYNAMNQGALNANGDYLMFLNSDDWLETDIINDYLLYIEKTNKKDLYYGDIIFYDGNNNNKSNITRKNKILFRVSGLNYLIFHPTTLIKRNTFINLGMFDESKKIASDQGLRLNILKNNMSYIYFPKVVTNFRIHSGSISSNKKNKAISDAECKYFYSKYLPRYKITILNILLFIQKFKIHLASVLKTKKK